MKPRRLIAVVLALCGIAQFGASAAAAAPSPARERVLGRELEVVYAGDRAVEVVIKYPLLSAGGDVTGRLYLSDFVTNAPVEDARVFLSIPTRGLVFPARRTGTPGVYAIPLAFPSNGSYDGILTISAPHIGSRQIPVAGLVVGPEGSGTVRSRNVALILLVSTLALVGIGAWLYLKREDSMRGTPESGEQR
ncbi:MAG: hypothetical protein WBX15_19985 [Thermoanaerobaculia bacterium]